MNITCERSLLYVALMSFSETNEWAICCFYEISTVPYLRSEIDTLKSLERKCNMHTIIISLLPLLQKSTEQNSWGNHQ